MKVKKISGERICVYLSKEELKERNISLSKMIENRQTLNFSLDNILYKINKEAGVNIGKDGCRFEIIPLIMGDLLISVLKNNRKNTTKIHKIVYKFDTFDDIFFVLNSFSTKYSMICDIFTYNGDCFLSLKKRTRIEDEILWILNEFGEKTLINSGFLEEHGKKLTNKNARQIAEKYFS